MPNETMMRVFHIDDGESVATYHLRDSHINLGYGECTTVAATQAKEVTLLGNPGWGLQTGAIVIVKFTYSVPAGATMNVNATGAKPIYHKNSGIAAGAIQAGDIVTFVYNDTNYVVLSIDRVMSNVFDEMLSSHIVASLGYTPMDAALKGANSGVAELGSDGKVPSSQLPSYVDDILEYANTAAFPATGESGKIYVALDTNLTYRWSGTEYVEISASLALGETSSTAYRGDRGAAAYAHAVTNKGSDFVSGFYKIETNAEGHVTSATAVTKADLLALGAADADDVASLALKVGPFAFRTDADNGHLYMDYDDQYYADKFSVNDSGHLIYTF